MEALSSEWQKEAQNLEEEIQQMYSDLQGEQVLLTEEMYQERLELIREKQKEARTFNNMPLTGSLNEMALPFYLTKHQVLRP